MFENLQVVCVLLGNEKTGTLKSCLSLKKCLNKAIKKVEEVKIWWNGKHLKLFHMWRVGELYISN